MELRHFRYFVAVAEELSFTRAAERLHTSQPSLSQQIRQIEAELKTALFQRTRRSVCLTTAGRVFLPEARAVLDQVAKATAAARTASGEPAHIAIGFLLSVEGNLLHRLLPEVRRQLPNLRIELRCLTTAEQVDQLIRREIDIAFLRVPQEDRRLRCELVLEEPIHVVIPAEHPWAKLRRIKPQQLHDVACIGVSEPEAGTLRTIIEHWAERTGIRLDMREQVGNVMAYMALVRLGRGVGLLPEFATTMLLSGLVHRPIIRAPRIGLGMATRSELQGELIARIAQIARGVLSHPHV